jgi:murein L,D-transpeptidase YcbB/YkuD
LFLATLPAFAQSSPASATPACDEGIARACRAAADELGAARKLIEAQTAELRAAKESADATALRLKLMADANQALTEQVEALKTALNAEMARAAEIEKLVGKFQLRIEQLERDKSRGRRLTGAAFVGGLVLGIAAGR